MEDVSDTIVPEKPPYGSEDHQEDCITKSAENVKDEDTKNKKNSANQELQGKCAGQAARACKTGEKSKPSSYKKRAANQKSAKHAKKGRKGTASKETPAAQNDMVGSSLVATEEAPAENKEESKKTEASAETEEAPASTEASAPTEEAPISTEVPVAPASTEASSETEVKSMKTEAPAETEEESVKVETSAKPEEAPATTETPAKSLNDAPTQLLSPPAGKASQPPTSTSRSIRHDVVGEELKAERKRVRKRKASPGKLAEVDEEASKELLRAVEFSSNAAEEDYREKERSLPGQKKRAEGA